MAQNETTTARRLAGSALLITTRPRPQRRLIETNHNRLLLTPSLAPGQLHLCEHPVTDRQLTAAAAAAATAAVTKHSEIYCDHLRAHQPSSSSITFNQPPQPAHGLALGAGPTVIVAVVVVIVIINSLLSPAPQDSLLSVRQIDPSVAQCAFDWKPCLSIHNLINHPIIYDPQPVAVWMPFGLVAKHSSKSRRIESEAD